MAEPTRLIQADAFAIHSTYYARIRNVYQGRKDFYALAYDADEVIDAVSVLPACTPANC